MLTWIELVQEVATEMGWDCDPEYADYILYEYTASLASGTETIPLSAAESSSGNTLLQGVPPLDLPPPQFGIT